MRRQVRECCCIHMFLYLHTVGLLCYELNEHVSRYTDAARQKILREIKVTKCNDCCAWQILEGVLCSIWSQKLQYLFSFLLSVHIPLIVMMRARVFTRIIIIVHGSMLSHVSTLVNNSLLLSSIPLWYSRLLLLKSGKMRIVSLRTYSRFAFKAPFISSLSILMVFISMHCRLDIP